MKLSRIMKIAMILLGILILAQFISTNAQTTSLPTTYHGEPVVYPIITQQGFATYYAYSLVLKEDGSGRNFIVLPDGVGLQKASDILATLPTADAVSYFDETTQESVGYITAFGGLGENFDLIPGNIYEISIRQPETWTLKQSFPGARIYPSLN